MLRVDESHRKDALSVWLVNVFSSVRKQNAVSVERKNKKKRDLYEQAKSNKIPMTFKFIAADTKMIHVINEVIIQQ